MNGQVEVTRVPENTKLVGKLQSGREVLLVSFTRELKTVSVKGEDGRVEWFEKVEFGWNVVLLGRNGKKSRELWFPEDEVVSVWALDDNTVAQALSA